MCTRTQAMLKLGSPDGAVALFKEMNAAGVRALLPTYTTLIKAHGLAKESSLADAFAVLDVARSSGITVDVVVREGQRGCCAFAQVYSTQAHRIGLRNERLPSFSRQ